MDSLTQIIKQVNRLEPIPTVIHNVLDFADDPESSLSDLVEVVERDPAITANLLKTVNSAHMGLPVKVDSVRQAVSMLGLQQVVEMVLSQNLSGNLQRSQKGYGLAKGDLWRQGLAVAMVARTLAGQRDLMLFRPSIPLPCSRISAKSFSTNMWPTSFRRSKNWWPKKA